MQSDRGGENERAGVSRMRTGERGGWEVEKVPRRGERVLEWAQERERVCVRGGVFSSQAIYFYHLA